MTHLMITTALHKQDKVDIGRILTGILLNLVLRLEHSHTYDRIAASEFAEVSQGISFSHVRDICKSAR